MSLKNSSASGGLEVLQLRRTDLRVDPLLGLTAVGGRGGGIEFERVEPVRDAMPDGVGSGRPDAGVDLVVQLVELVLDLGLGLAADGTPTALAVAVVAEGDRADEAVVDLVPGDAVVSASAASWWCTHRRGSFRSGLLRSSTVTQEVLRRPWEVGVRQAASSRDAMNSASC
jgi:hypothetical protein